MRKGHSEIYQQDIVDVLDKQLLEGMGVLLTEEEQQKCEASVCSLSVFFDSSKSTGKLYNGILIIM